MRSVDRGARIGVAPVGRTRHSATGPGRSGGSGPPSPTTIDVTVPALVDCREWWAGCQARVHRPGWPGGARVRDSTGHEPPPTSRRAGLDGDTRASKGVSPRHGIRSPVQTGIGRWQLLRTGGRRRQERAVGCGLGGGDRGSRESASCPWRSTCPTQASRLPAEANWRSHRRAKPVAMELRCGYSAASPVMVRRPRPPRGDRRRILGLRPSAAIPAVRCRDPSAGTGPGEQRRHGDTSGYSRQQPALRRPVGQSETR